MKPVSFKFKIIIGIVLFIVLVGATYYEVTRTARVIAARESAADAAWEDEHNETLQ